MTRRPAWVAAGGTALLAACSSIPFFGGGRYADRTPEQLLAEAGVDLAKVEEGAAAGNPEPGLAREALRKLEYLRDKRGGGPDKETLEFRRVQALHALGRRWDAYTAAKAFAEAYPTSTRRPDLERILHEIGLAYDRDTEGIWLLGWFPRRGSAVPVFETLVEHFPRGDYADDALRRIGGYHFDEEEWIEARTAYERLLKGYSGSEWADLADFRVGICNLEEAGAPSHDLGAMRRAREKLEGYLKSRPEGGKRAEAQAALAQVLEMLAEREWRTGEFYRRIGNSFGARHHWGETVSGFPGTAAAGKAAAALRALGPAETLPAPASRPGAPGTGGGSP
ncbi:MAG: outer membrane protein assembly factor BamD [Planctomycetes bacterium]|nr:outer membrane protein assembly factor BamD [Planctomycetota bacterium]